jgi:hypothetical protein
MTAPKIYIETLGRPLEQAGSHECHQLALERAHHRAAGIAAAEDYLERKAEERPLRIFRMLMLALIFAAMGGIGATIVFKGWANVEHEISYARKG